MSYNQKKFEEIAFKNIFDNHIVFKTMSDSYFMLERQFHQFILN